MAERLAWPLRIASDGRFATVAQDSPADIEQCLTAIANSTPGVRWDALGMGIEALEFHERPLDTSQIAAALATYEPRVTLELIQTTPALRQILDAAVARLTAQEPA